MAGDKAGGGGGGGDFGQNFHELFSWGEANFLVYFEGGRGGTGGGTIFFRENYMARQIFSKCKIRQVQHRSADCHQLDP